jgi:hypothetical protein
MHRSLTPLFAAALLVLAAPPAGPDALTHALSLAGAVLAIAE